MIVIGLTGSIGMGKSETASMFADLGIATFDADQAVHALYARGGEGVETVRALFPDAISQGAVDREKLSEIVLRDKDALARLEARIHPLVGAARQRFLGEAVRAGADMVVFDIPLLFESGALQGIDKTVVVSAPPDIQRQRVLARPGMTPDKLAAILAKQMPDEEKRKRADFVVETGFGLDHARKQVETIVSRLRAKEQA